MITWEHLSNWPISVALAAAALIFLLLQTRNIPRISILSFRFAQISLLCIALLGPVREIVVPMRKALALIDVSNSISAERGQRLLDQLAKLRANDLKIELLPFAKAVAPIALEIGAHNDFPQLQKAWSKLDLSKSNLEEAISSSQAQRASPLFLLSDGQETMGDALAYVTSHPRQAPLFPLVDFEPLADSIPFRISYLDAPLLAPAEKSVTVRATVTNSSDTPQEGTLELIHGNERIAQQHVMLPPHSEQLMTAQSNPAQMGLKEIRAVLTPTSPAMPSTRQSVYLGSEQREQILILNGSADDARFLPQALGNLSYQVKSVTPNPAQPLPALSEFSAVLFNNIAARQLPASLLYALPEYVKGGGGFGMIGGNASFGLGGYINTPIEEILPVKLVPPQTEQKRLTVAVELIIDKSGSMSSGGKLDFAKEAAREVIRNLKDDDFGGVIGFDAAPFIVVKLDQIGPARDQIIDRIGRLFPAGHTNLYPAIEEGRRSLARVNAGRKHMIILTDGRVPDAGPFYIELVKQMRIVGVTVSTVMLGAEADFGMLREMADSGGGTFYQTEDARNLPRIFLQDIKAATGERTMKEERQYYVRQARDLHSTQLRAFPEVRGYVETKLRERANLELIAYANDKADPLLASWNVGRGRSIAFTSDANGRWSNQWISWEQFHTFWSDLIDSLVHTDKTDQERIQYALRHTVERGALQLDLTIFNEHFSGDVQAEVLQPTGERSTLSFDPTVRGRYHASLTNAQAGKYEIHLLPNRHLAPIAFEIAPSVIGEQPGLNLRLLQHLADQSHGTLNPSSERILSSAKPQVIRSDLSPYLIALALAFLMAEAWIRLRGREKRRVVGVRI